MKKLFVILILLLLTATAKAYRFIWGGTVTISQPVQGDLYLAGGTVYVNAPVYGDLIVAGGTVFINDTVKNDLLLAGGEVRIKGYVEDDIRCAGGKLYFSGGIGGDLVIAGGEVHIDRNTLIAGGFISSGGKVIFNGTVMQKLQTTAGIFEFNGRASKGLDCRSDKALINGKVTGPTVLAARNFQIGSGAQLNGDVRYWNKKGEADFKNALVGGTATYDPSLRINGKNWYYLGHASAFAFIWYLGMVFLLIMLIEYLFSATFRKAGDTFYNSSLRSLGWGLMFLIGVPIAIIVSLITIIGIPVGVLLLFSYVGIMLLATVITSVVGANWINNRFSYHWGYWKMVLSALALFIMLKLISFTPFLGWLIMGLLACMAFGSVLLNINIRKKRIAIP